MAPRKGNRIAKEEVLHRWTSLDVERRQEALRFTDAGLVARIVEALQNLYLQKLVSGNMASAQSTFEALALMNRAFVLRGEQGTDVKVNVMEVTREFVADVEDFLRELQGVLPDFLSGSRRVIPAACWGTRLWAQRPSTFKAFQEQIAKTVEQALWAMGVDPRFAPAPAEFDEQDWIQADKTSKSKKGFSNAPGQVQQEEMTISDNQLPPERLVSFGDVFDADHGTGEVVVKLGFIEFDEGPGLRKKFLSQKGKAKTDSFLQINEDSAIVDAQEYVPPHLDEAVINEERLEESQHILTPSSDALKTESGHAESVSSGAETDIPQSPGSQGNTTVMLRNLPNNYTRDMLLHLLEGQGFSGLYDFVYLPMDFSKRANLGYAFVNLVSPQIAAKLWQAMAGFSDWAIPSAKVCEVGWSHPYQGLQANINRYRNSPVMHESVPEEYRPVLLSNGVPQQMPPPTRKLKVPFHSRQQQKPRRA